MAFLITKELIFGFQILDLKDHFSASLTSPKIVKLVKSLNLIPKTKNDAITEDQ